MQLRENGTDLANSWRRRTSNVRFAFRVLPLPVFVALCATLMLACHREKAPEAREVAGETTLTGATVAPSKENDDAVLQIVEARCARAVTCNTETNKAECLQTMRTRLESELEPARCPNGIDQNSLGLCLEAIRNETCGSPIETLARASACATTKMCLSAREPN